MPNEETEMMFRTGKQLWRTARDLQKRAHALPDAKIPIADSTQAWGYLLTICILRPFAVEYLLKGLSVRAAGGFTKTHDLLELYEALDSGTQNEIAEQGAQQDIDIPEFLHDYGNVFEDWRYPLEGISSKPNPAGFDIVLAVLVGVCEPGSPEARRILETENEHRAV